MVDYYRQFLLAALLWTRCGRVDAVFCGSYSSGGCQSEYNNAMNNGNLATSFCTPNGRCKDSSFRAQCKLCCTKCSPPTTTTTIAPTTTTIAPTTTTIAPTTTATTTIAPTTTTTTIAPTTTTIAPTTTTIATTTEVPTTTTKAPTTTTEATTTITMPTTTTISTTITTEAPTTTTITTAPTTIATSTEAPTTTTEAVWPQFGANNSKCTVAQDDVASQAACQELAVAAGHSYYQYAHEEGSCATVDSCDDVITDTDWDWKIYHQASYEYISVAGCSNFASINIQTLTDQAYTADSCASLCAATLGCTHFDIAILDQGFVWSYPGRCDLHNFSCQYDSNPKFRQYKLEAPMTTSEGPTTTTLAPTTTTTDPPTTTTTIAPITTTIATTTTTIAPTTTTIAPTTAICGTFSSGGCQSEHNNAMNNGNLATSFCTPNGRCKDSSFRAECKWCCTKCVPPTTTTTIAPTTTTIVPTTTTIAPTTTTIAPTTAICGTFSSGGCQSEYNNAMNNGNLATSFCTPNGRCKDSSFRAQCELCCTECGPQTTTTTIAPTTITIDPTTSTTAPATTTAATTTETPTTTTEAPTTTTEATTTTVEGPATTTAAPTTTTISTTTTTEAVATTLSGDHAAGVSSLRLLNVSRISAGMSLTIADVENSETKTIVSVNADRRLVSRRLVAAGTVTIDSPLQNSYSHGTSIVMIPQDTTTTIVVQAPTTTSGGPTTTMVAPTTSRITLSETRVSTTTIGAPTTSTITLSTMTTHQSTISDTSAIIMTSTTQTTIARSTIATSTSTIAIADTTGLSGSSIATSTSFVERNAVSRKVVALIRQATNTENLLVASLISGANVTGSRQVSQAFSGGFVVAQAIEGDADVGIAFYVQDTVVAVEGSSELIKALNVTRVAVVVTVFHGTVDALQDNASDAPQLFALPVSIRLVSDSNLDITHLGGNTLRIRVAQTNRTDLVCGFWNESHSFWSVEGLTTSYGDNGDMWCTTPHLTLFGSLIMPFTEMGDAISCSNLQILTLDAFSKVASGDWAMRGPAIVFWVMVALLTAAFLVGRVHDYHTRKRLHIWTDENFLAYGESHSSCWLCALARDIFQTFVLDVIGVVKNADKLKFAAATKDAKDQEAEDAEVCKSHIHKRGERKGSTKKSFGSMFSSSTFASADRSSRASTSVFSIGSESTIECENSFQEARSTNNLLPHVNDLQSAPFGEESSNELSLAESTGIDGHIASSKGLMLMSHARTLPNPGTAFCSCLKCIKWCLRKIALQAARYAVELVMANAALVTTSDLKHHVKEVRKPVDEEDAEGDDNDAGPRKTKKLRRSDFRMLESIETQGGPSGICSSYILGRVSAGQKRKLHWDVGYVCKKNSPRVLWALFAAQHPAYGIVSISIFTTSSMQASIFAASLLGPALIAALFFSVTGEALSYKSSQECAVSGARKFWRAFAVGLFSWVLSSLPLLITSSMIKHYFVERESWSEKSRQRWLRSWRYQDAVIYWGMVIYCIFCVLYVVVFLANVQGRDQDMWLVSYATFVVEDFLLVPLVIAIVLFLVSTLVRCTNAEIFDRLIDDLEVDVDAVDRKLKDQPSFEENNVPTTLSAESADVQPVVSKIGKLDDVTLDVEEQFADNNGFHDAPLAIQPRHSISSTASMTALLQSSRDSPGERTNSGNQLDDNDIVVSHASTGLVLYRSSPRPSISLEDASISSEDVARLFEI